jgi:hypothetical protein
MSILNFISKLLKTTFLSSESDKKETGFKQRFGDLFFKERYFLHVDGTLQKMAFILNVSEDYLSSYVLANYQMDFSALCNKHRIEHFQAAMEDPNNSDIPISSLIMGSGFESVEKFKVSLQSDKSSL